MPNFMHPRLQEHLAKRGTASMYPNTVTRQTFNTTYNTTNEPIQTAVDDPTLVDVPAYIEPLDKRLELRKPDQTIVTNGFNIAIAGYYDVNEGQQLVDELGNAYNIIMASNDAFQTQTNVIAEIINTNVATA